MNSILSLEGILSIIIPVRDEEKNVPLLCQRIQKVCFELDLKWEVIFVEDSSKDNTKNVISDICRENKRFKAIFLTRSFGHHEAFSAGLDHAKGDHLIMMDGDLQHPPEIIPELIEEYNNGFDIVYAKRETSEGLVQQTGSNLVNLLMNKFSDYPIKLNFSIFRIFSRTVANYLSMMPEKRRFLIGMMSWQGFKTSEITFKEETRFSGKTKYNLRKRIELSYNALTSFTVKPLRFGIYIGLLTSFCSFIAGFYYIVKYFLIGIPVEGYTSLIVLLLFLCGLILFTLGIIGEYIGNIFIELKNRPLYIIKDKINLL